MDLTDYYEILQISPKAELQTVQRVYKMLAARYHPDNPVTGDMEKFLHLQHAFQVLSDEKARAEYDLNYHCQHPRPISVFETEDFMSGIDAEANRRMGVLCLLYSRRRSRPDRPSLSLLEFETIMSIPREHLEFTVWYLREKGYVRSNDSGELVITAEGVDHVEAKLPHDRIARKLLKAPGEGFSWSASIEPDNSNKA